MSALWLAIDTATDRASVAAGPPPRTLTSVTISGARRYAAEVVTAVDQVLRRLDARPGDVGGIVVADGPGSFTGLRIGWAAAKGLAHERELPLRAVPSLLAAAAGAAGRVGGGPAVACFDALRGQVFGAAYDFTPGAVHSIVPPRLATMDELARAIAARPRVVVGDGALRYMDGVPSWSGVLRLELDAVAPGAESLLQLVDVPGAFRAIDAGAEPVYGRLAEAQVRWEAEHGRALPDPSSRGG